jgi:serine/threonine protein phosphatase PrpC
MDAPLALQSVGLSIVGRRTNNEDALLLRPSLGLFVVADGMGGYEGGEVASATVVDALAGFVAKNDLDPEGTWPVRERGDLGPLEMLVEASLRVADREVKAKKQGVLAKMGSTAVVALFRGARVVIGHVGDSRVYRLRGEELAQLTDDHSVAAELAKNGMGDREVSPAFLACLTRAIGMEGDTVADVRGEAVRPGDTYLLCSDGLWGSLPHATIAELLRASSLADACRALVEAAHAAGSTDNITAVLVRAHSGKRP